MIKFERYTKIMTTMVLIFTLPMSNLASKSRVKGTTYDVQSSQASFVSFATSISDVLVTTVLAGLAQLMGNAGIVLVFVGLFASFVMLKGKKIIYNYDKEYTFNS